jgi:hypothetical protein
VSVIDVTIHGVGKGPCSLSGKECEGLVVTFKDGTLKEGLLSHKAFLQLVKMKFAQGGKPSGQPAPAVPAAAAKS